MKTLLTALVLILSTSPAFAAGNLANRLRALADSAESAQLSPAKRNQISSHIDQIKKLLKGPGPAPGLMHANCATARGLRVLAGDDVDVSEMKKLVDVICQSPANPPGSIFYPGGGYAYVKGNFSDNGSWKYPNGKYALVSGNYSDKGAWKYPNGKYAFVSGNFSDKGSWKYPNGKYAFVSGNYSDTGAYKYPNGKYAFVAGNFSDKGSYKYSNGKYAFVNGNYTNKHRWFYPNGDRFKDDPNFNVDDLIQLIENSNNSVFPQNYRKASKMAPKELGAAIIYGWAYSVVGD